MKKWVLCLVLQSLFASQAMALPTFNERVNHSISDILDTVRSGDVAVFDADGTLWADDVGESFLKWLVKEKKLIDTDPALYQKYEAMCQSSHLKCYGYAVQVMAGLKESDVKQWSEAFFKKYFVSKIYPGQKALIQSLQAKGVKVWIVSASHQWIVEAGAPYLGIPKKQVVGIRLKVRNGLLTSELLPPVTYRPGKVEAIKKYIGKIPVLVSGNSMTDFEMLDFSKQYALVINPKDKGPLQDNLSLLAAQKGWLVQYWPHRD